jgi:hypothetical protein
VKIEYRKNLTALKASISTENSYTALFPYAKQDDLLLTLPENIMPVQNNSGVQERILLRDFSQSLGENWTADALRTAAQNYLAANNINAPDISLDVDFVHLWQSPEYAQYSDLERVALCDIVTVRHPDLGICERVCPQDTQQFTVSAKVIKTVYDCLSERYKKITVGSAKSNMAAVIAGVREEIEALEAPDISAIQVLINQAVQDASDAIKNGFASGKVILNPQTNPQELLILCDANNTIQTAQKLWRFNSGGLGFSSTGYNGSYGTAITANGQIVADFITAGTLTANVIKAGILSDALGKFSVNMTTGAASLSGATISGGSVTITNGSKSTVIDANGLTTSYATITGGSVSIGGSAFRTEIAAGALSQYALGDGTFICGLTPFSAGSDYRPTLYVGSDSRVTGFSIAYQSGGNIVNIAQFDKTEIDLVKPVTCDAGLTVASGIRCPTGSSLLLAAPDSNRYVTFRVGSTDEAYVASDGLHITDTLYCKNLSVTNPPWMTALPASPDFSGTCYANRFCAWADGQAFQINTYSVLDVSSAGNVAVNGGLYSYGYPLNLHGGNYCRLMVNGSTKAYCDASGFNNSSVAEQKDDIQPADSVLPLIQSATLYSYKYKAGYTFATQSDAANPLPNPGEFAGQTAEEEPEHMGFVIGDGYAAPPDIVLSKAGDAVNLYSMIAVCWKGIQELAVLLKGGGSDGS